MIFWLKIKRSSEFGFKFFLRNIFDVILSLLTHEFDLNMYKILTEASGIYQMLLTYFQCLLYSWLYRNETNSWMLNIIFSFFITVACKFRNYCKEILKATLRNINQCVYRRVHRKNLCYPVIKILKKFVIYFPLICENWSCRLKDVEITPHI